jgi:hypothetical protein
VIERDLLKTSLIMILTLCGADGCGSSQVEPADAGARIDHLLKDGATQDGPLNDGPLDDAPLDDAPKDTFLADRAQADAEVVDGALDAQPTPKPYGGALLVHPLARTPLMGFNTYYASRISRFQVNQKAVEAIATDMAASGMRDAGYRLLSIDIGWWYARPENGAHTRVVDSATGQRSQIVPGPLISDIAGLVGHIHGQGLLAGVYTDTGAGDRAGCGGFPGSGAFMSSDLTQFVRWGFDYLKLDHCGGNPQATAAGQLDDGFGGTRYEYTRWQQAIEAVGRSSGKTLLFNAAVWDRHRSTGWAYEVANTWRTGWILTTGVRRARQLRSDRVASHLLGDHSTQLRRNDVRLLLGPGTSIAPTTC